MSFKQPALYIGVILMMGAVVTTALGGGFWGQETFWQIQWQHQTFSSLCHQIPKRSFWMGGQPMAVCSRCFGIYTGFLAGWLSLPLLGVLNIRMPTGYKLFFLIILGINIIDVLGNLLGFWQNTLVSRFILGWPVGLAAAVLFAGSFFKRKTKPKETYYGAITKSGS